MSRLVAFFAIFFISSQVLQADIVSTFDTNAEGWLPVGGALSHNASGGNPTGFIQVADTNGSTIFDVVAPAAFHGDLSQYNGGRISYDAITTNSGNGTSVIDLGLRYGAITITGNGESASFDFGYVPSSTWTAYLAPLNAADWGKNQAEWAGILGDVTDIRVAIEGFSGDDVMGFDNFHVSVPEPSAGVVTLFFGCIGVLRRRRKS